MVETRPQNQRFPTAQQAVVITLSGFAMAFFGCLGGIAAFDRSDTLGFIGIGVFVVGSLACLFGLVLVGFLFFRALFRGPRTPPAPPPPAADVPKAS